MSAHLSLVESRPSERGPITSEREVHYFCVGRDRWTIYDRRLDPASPGAFLGRLRRIAGVFEISFADRSRPCVYCSSLAASRSEFVVADRPVSPGLRLV